MGMELDYMPMEFLLFAYKIRIFFPSSFPQEKK